MRYIVQRYSRHPIFEPAEGGYYYEGLEADDTPEPIIRDTKAEAVEALRKLVENENDLMVEEYITGGGSGDANDRIEGYLYIARDGTSAESGHHRHIGDGEEYYVEALNRRGQHSKGRALYQ